VALFVYTDVAARGVLLALSQRQVRVPEDLRLTLHRNAEVGLLCPVPAMFIDVRARDIAAGLVEVLHAAHQGAVTQPVVVPAQFTDGESDRASDQRALAGAGACRERPEARISSHTLLQS
jgi:DNA-binding LacI/PurR family transcriptional regulator